MLRAEEISEMRFLRHILCFYGVNGVLPVVQWVEKEVSASVIYRDTCILNMQPLFAVLELTKVIRQT